MTMMDISDVARRWSELVRKIERGEIEEIVITRDGRPAVRLAPLDAAPSAAAAEQHD